MGCPPATPTARNAGPQGRTLWGRCWVHTPTPKATGTHGSRNPGCPPQRIGGRGRDSAWHQTPLTTVAGQPPRGRPPTTPTARSPQRGCKPKGQCWAPTPTHPRPKHMGSGPRQPAQRVGNQGRGSAGPQTPLTTEEGTPPRHAPPPPPQRATPTRRGARCGAGAGSPRPHQPHPGHTDRGTPATRPRGWAAKGGTAPDTRRPSQRRQANSPGYGPPPPPRHAAPAGHATQGDSAGPPHPRTHTNSTWVADPDSPPEGWAAGEGGAPDLRRPSQRRKVPPRGRPFASPTARNAGQQGRTLWGRCRVPTPAPTAPGAHGSRNPGCPPGGRTVGGGRAPDLGRPSQRRKAAPPGTPFRHPHSAQRWPVRAHAAGPVLGPQARTNRTRDTRVAEPLLPPPEDGRPGEGQCLTPDAPRNGGRPPPPGDGPPPPPRHAAPTGHASQGDSENDVLGLCPRYFDEILQVLKLVTQTKAASRARTGCGSNQ